MMPKLFNGLPHPRYRLWGSCVMCTTLYLELMILMKRTKQWRWSQAMEVHSQCSFRGQQLLERVPISRPCHMKPQQQFGGPLQRMYPRGRFSDIWKGKYISVLICNQVVLVRFSGSRQVLFYFILRTTSQKTKHCGWFCITLQYVVELVSLRSAYFELEPDIVPTGSQGKARSRQSSVASVPVEVTTLCRRDEPVPVPHNEPPKVRMRRLPSNDTLLEQPENEWTVFKGQFRMQDTRHICFYRLRGYRHVLL